MCLPYDMAQRRHEEGARDLLPSSSPAALIPACSPTSHTVNALPPFFPRPVSLDLLLTFFCGKCPEKEQARQRKLSTF